MFEKITPEQAGISSRTVSSFIKKLEKRGAFTHGLLFMRNGKIFTEAYWQPFHQEFSHRMYSQTKSLVSLAIGLLEEEGKLTLEDKIAAHFPEKIDGELPAYLGEQTVREMLLMTTAGMPYSWFLAGDKDRTHLYFNDDRKTHPSGTLWQYDSAGSQVLCSLVEKLSGKTLLDYLKEKLFNEMGCFQSATVLKAPNGDSWGDSAMVCTLRDMAAVGQLVMNYGVWKGKRLMNERYLREATSKRTDNTETVHYSTYHQGYGYQIWRVCGNGFAFVGMGDQLTVCYPDKGLLFACVSDNQGAGNLIREAILANLEDMFVDEIKDEALPENAEAQAELQALIEGLQLRSLQGEPDSIFRKELSGKEYVCEENPMGITKFSFLFHDEKGGEFHYTNQQGDKILPFAVNGNVFAKFPQFGYSDEYGATPTTNGFLYDAAFSCAWLEEKKLRLLVQIVDRYFGNLSMTFSFKGNEVYAVFAKSAEYFLTEYHGALIGKRKDTACNS